MDNEIKFEYYYGKESEQFSFYRIPRLLIKDERFKGISNDAKLLYGLMLDRMSLSMKNGWIDDENRVYIHYTAENVMEDLCCAKEKCSKLFKELDSINGIGLIEKKRQGLGKPDIIYVKNFAIDSRNERDNSTHNETDELQEVRKSNFKECEDSNTGSTKIEPQEKIEISEVRKTNFKKLDDKISRGSKNELQEVRKQNTNYNNNNYTDPNYNKMIYINHINQSDNTDLETERCDVIDETSAYMEIIKENLEFDERMQYEDKETREYLDEIYNLICDVVCVKRKSIRIAGEDYPYELVKSRFLKLKYFHAKYVIDCISRMTEKITNMKAYMLTSLYNAPTTANMYLQNEVQNDLYGGR